MLSKLKEMLNKPRLIQEKIELLEVHLMAIEVWLALLADCERAAQREPDNEELNHVAEDIYRDAKHRLKLSIKAAKADLKELQKLTK